MAKEFHATFYAKREYRSHLSDKLFWNSPVSHGCFMSILYHLLRVNFSINEGNSLDLIKRESVVNMGRILTLNLPRFLFKADWFLTFQCKTTHPPIYLKYLRYHGIPRFTPHFALRISPGQRVLSFLRVI